MSSSPKAQSTRNEPDYTGTVLDGAYEIGALLGSGGMGYVHRARVIDTGREVAIKILRAQHVSNQTLVARFLREARAEALAKHPNIVDVIDAGLDAKGTPYIVQELLTGEDLGEFLARKGGRLPSQEALRILLPAADGMAHAHAAGVIHRDLKPENIFLARDTQGNTVPKILDFGVSKIASEERTVDDGTKAGTILGTPEYMSPEQIQDGRTIDVRADIWALGIILYELLTGEIPFPDRGSRRIFIHICLSDPIPLDTRVPGISPDLVRIVDRCLRRDRAARYPTAAELARDLAHVLAQRPVEPTRRLAAISPKMAAAVVSPAPRHDAPLSPFGAPIAWPAVSPAPAPRESVPTLDEGAVPTSSPPSSPLPASSTASNPPRLMSAIVLKAPETAPTPAPARKAMVRSPIVLGVLVFLLGIVALVLTLR